MPEHFSPAQQCTEACVLEIFEQIAYDKESEYIDQIIII